MSIPFNKQLDFSYGVADQVSPLIRRVVAENPSAFTFHGTGTYIVGNGRVARCQIQNARNQKIGPNNMT